MKKLHFIKKTISNLRNLEQLKGGAASEATSVNYETTPCDSLKECTFTLLPDCPATSSRATEGRSRDGN